MYEIDIWTKTHKAPRGEPKRAIVFDNMNRKRVARFYDAEEAQEAAWIIEEMCRDTAFIKAVVVTVSYTSRAD